MSLSSFEHVVRFEPGHTIRRLKNDGSDHGIASMQIRFLCSGEHGTTQFLMFTGWYPEKVLNRRGWNEWHTDAPMAADLGAHWDTPWSSYMTEPGNEWAHRDCDVRGSGSCWYDGSGLRAEPVLDAFFSEGESAVWTFLEKEYHDIDDLALMLNTDR